MRPDNTIQYNTIQYNTIQYNTIQYNTIQYNTIQYKKMLQDVKATRSVRDFLFLLQNHVNQYKL